jgi:phage shock protein C
MFCTSCGTRMLDQDRFCVACGKPATVMAAAWQPPPRLLERDMYRKRLGGVCAGVANYLNADVTMVRLVYVLLVLFTGVPLILYFIGWILMPRNDLRQAIAAPYVG